MYSSEYTSGFFWPAALHLAAPPSPRHEGNVGQAPSGREKWWRAASATPLRRGLAGCEKTVVAREQVGRVDLVHLVCFVHLVGLVQPNKQNRPNKQEKPAGPRVSRATIGTAEVGDDEFRVGDGVCREGGCVLIGYRGAQSLGCLADGKRERRVLLNLPEMGHRIPAPSWD